MSMLRIEKGSNYQITEHFNLTKDHFDCKCKSRFCTHTYVYEPTLEFVEEMRVRLGFPMTFSCGYRCPKHNRSKSVGGGEFSQHMWGLAVDIKPIEKNKKIYQEKKYHIFAYAIANLPHTGGLGKYNSFVHIDLREQKARW